VAKRSGKKKSALSPVISRGSPAAAPGSGGKAPGSRWLWLSAAVLIVSGYALLHKVDPGGRNGWAIVSPALLLTGYLLIIPAIIQTYRR